MLDYRIQKKYDWKSISIFDASWKNGSQGCKKAGMTCSYRPPAKWRGRILIGSSVFLLELSLMMIGGGRRTLCPRKDGIAGGCASSAINLIRYVCHWLIQSNIENIAVILNLENLAVAHYLTISRCIRFGLREDLAC